MQSTIYVEMAPGVTVDDLYQQLSSAYEVIVKSCIGTVTHFSPPASFFSYILFKTTLSQRTFLQYTSSTTYMLFCYKYAVYETIKSKMTDSYACLLSFHKLSLETSNLFFFFFKMSYKIRENSENSCLY